MEQRMINNTNSRIRLTIPVAFLHPVVPSLTSHSSQAYKIEYQQLKNHNLYLIHFGTPTLKQAVLAHCKHQDFRRGQGKRIL